MSLISLGLVVFLCNLAPILAPPTWTVIVFFLITRDLNPVATVIIAALAAGSGRYLLAIGTRALRNYIPEKARKNLFDAGIVFDENQSRRFGLIALFILSPLPSAQLFEAAGLMQMNLKRLTLAFFSGRIFTYSFYAAGASTLKTTDFGKVITDALRSPFAIALEIGSIALIWIIAKIDWKRFINPASLEPLE
jgi:membrane protein YqaA with SNARE-associated domain